MIFGYFFILIVLIKSSLVVKGLQQGLMEDPRDWFWGDGLCEKDGLWLG